VDILTVHFHSMHNKHNMAAMGRCTIQTTEHADRRPYISSNRIKWTRNNKQTPWSESASELYRPSDLRLSTNWLPTFVGKGCHVVSVTDPYGRILDFLDRSRYFSTKHLLSCTHEAEWTPFQTHYCFPFLFFSRKSGSAGNRTWASGSVAKNSDH
jgi:hypothetical protein